MIAGNLIRNVEHFESEYQKYIATSNEIDESGRDVSSLEGINHN
jgi:hypothetical protein